MVSDSVSGSGSGSGAGSISLKNSVVDKALEWGLVLISVFVHAYKSLE